MYYGIIIALLLLCFYQDVKFRGIHWVIFPTLALVSYFANETHQWSDTWNNLLFITGCLLALTLYLSLKLGKLTNITQGFFSWGDILFLIAIAPLCSFELYVYLFTFGTISTLLIHLIASMIKPQKTIPYAGYLSIAVIAVLLFRIESISNLFCA